MTRKLGLVSNHHSLNHQSDSLPQGIFLCLQVMNLLSLVMVLHPWTVTHNKTLNFFQVTIGRSVRVSQMLRKVSLKYSIVTYCAHLIKHVLPLFLKMTCMRIYSHSDVKLFAGGSREMDRGKTSQDTLAWGDFNVQTAEKTSFTSIYLCVLSVQWLKTLSISLRRRHSMWREYANLLETWYHNFLVC